MATSAAARGLSNCILFSRASLRNLIRRRVYFFLVLLLFLVALPNLSIIFTGQRPIRTRDYQDTRSFNISVTPPTEIGYDRDQSCQYPILDAFDPTVLPYYQYVPPLACDPVQPDFTYITDFSSVQTDEDWKIWNIREYDTIYLHESVEIQARYDGKEYQILYPSVRVDENVESKKMDLLKNAAKRPPNVLIIAVDSMSRLSFIRSLPKTRRVLSDLQSIELQGYTKIDDNTFPNLLALLTGYKMTIHESELEGSVQHDYVDHYPFVWKNFSSKGYITALAEQSSGFLGDFAGFEEQPVDWSLQSFNSLASSLITDHACLRNDPVEKVIFDSIYRFIASRNNSGPPYFLFSYLWRLTHGRSDDAMKMDNIFADLLRRLLDHGYLNNTFVFVLGDHGPRFGEVRRTLIGRYEERMPYFSITAPPWFRDQFPVQFETLKNNIWRLTCHFDAYETLVDILNEEFGDENRPRLKNRGYSLFAPVPKSRTCEEAGISAHYCVCQKEKNLNNSAGIVKSAAGFALDYINKDLLGDWKELCHQLRIEHIQTAQRLEASDSVKYGKRFDYDELLIETFVEGVVSHVRVAFTTSPSDGIFEALVQIHEANSTDAKTIFNATRVLDISRLNAYGRDGDCVKSESAHLAKFCYCKRRASPGRDV